MAKIVRLILGDQLNSKHSWFEKKDDSVTYLMMEMRQETDYAKHHIQKVVGFFQVMRTFAEEIKDRGHKLIYIKLDDAGNEQDLKKNLNRLVEKEGFDHFEYMLPDEFRLDKQLREICSSFSISSKSYDTEHFLTDRDFLKTFFKGKKTYLMESFYREMRKKYDILMDGKEPLTGKWNYDEANRNKLKDTSILEPQLLKSRDVSELVNMIEKAEVKTIGNIDAQNFSWPHSRRESLALVDYFCEKLLPNFGMYQDAMHTEDPFLFHSRLSFSLNTKLISPLEVVEKVEKYWYEHQNQIDIAQVEGFIRQIIGWREYMRGVYWAKMPEYQNLNFFGNQRKLPEFFWTGDTKMNCLKHAIGQSLDHAYAHHIQRLMITGNFALIAGIKPDDVDAWYLGIYIDAIEWVEITNTRGMSQFADGGIVGTKPYAASSNYIDKMSNYCGSCHYSKSKKTGDKACPFNSLYWHFYNRNEDKLAKNPRIGMAYRTLAKMKNKDEILKQAEKYLNDLDSL